MTRQGVPVRGICAAGHVLETLSPPGRVTWRGRCPTGNCRHNVVARRIRTQDRAPAPALDDAGAAAPPASPPSRAAAGGRVRKVTSYRATPEPSFDTDPRPRARAPGGDGSRVRPDPGADDGQARPARVEDRQPEPEPGPRRAGIRERARQRRAERQRAQLVEPDDVIPGIYR